MMWVLVSILSYDIWFYISHILLHEFLYKYHREHHKADEPRFLDTYRGHIIETSLQGLGMFFPCTVYAYSSYDVFIILCFLNIRGMMRHDDRLIWLIGNHHLLHHKYPLYNFGEYWLDSLMGTEYPNKYEYKYGLLYS